MTTTPRSTTPRSTLLFIVGTMMLSAILACGPPSIIQEIDQEEAAEAAELFLTERELERISLSASPEFYCPGEVVTVEWNAGSQYPECNPGVEGSSCLKNSLFIRSVAEWFVRDSSAYAMNGAGSITFANDTEEATFEYFIYQESIRDADNPAGQESSGDQFITSRSVRVQPITSQTTILSYQLLCSGGELIVALNQQSPPVTNNSACLAISEVSTSAEGLTTVRADGGDWTEVDPYSDTEPTSSAGVAGYQPEDTEVDIAESIDVSQFVAAGTYCEDGERLPRHADGTPFIEGFLVTFTLTCHTPEDLQGAEQQEACLAARTTTADTQIFYSDLPTPTDNDEDEEDGGEEDQGGDKDSGGSSSDDDKDDSDPQPVDICAEHGGTEFTGEVCVCSGFVDNVTICNDGTKFDDVTDTACTPNPADCPASGDGGDGGDGQNCHIVCVPNCPGGACAGCTDQLVCDN